MFSCVLGLQSMLATHARLDPTVELITYSFVFCPQHSHHDVKCNIRICFSHSPLFFQARSRRPASTAASVVRPAPKQSFQVHVDEDAEQIGHIGQTVGSQVLSVRKSEASNNPLKVLSSVSITMDNQRNAQAKALMTSVVRLVRFTLEPGNFILIIFQDFVFW